MERQVAPYTGSGEPDLCGLSDDPAEYAFGELKLPQTMEEEKSRSWQQQHIPVT